MMRKFWITSVSLLLLGFLVLLLPSCILQPPDINVPPRQNLILNNVTVINPSLNRATGRRVVVAGDRIQAVGDSIAAEPDAYEGMFVLPGLIDMHTHYPTGISIGVRESASLLFLASGVTTIRDTGAIGSSPGDIRRRIRAGDFPGPRMFLCGPAIDGDPQTHQLTYSVANSEEARELVNSLAAEGEVDCIKIYSRLPLESLQAVREAATEHSLPLLGHLPSRISLAESGLDDAQHLFGLATKQPQTSFADEWGDWDRVDAQYTAEIIQTSLAHGIAHTPTLVTFAKLSKLQELSSEEYSGALPLFYPEVIWHPLKGFPAIIELTQADIDRLSAAVPHMKSLVGQMYQSGVQLHLGSDSFMPFVTPGESLIGEMAEPFMSSTGPPLPPWVVSAS